MKRLLRRTALVVCALAAASCGDENVRELVPEIRVTPTHVTEDGAALLDFGPVPVLNVRTLKLLVDNLGQVDLVLGEVAVEGPEGIFTLAPEAVGLVVPGGGTGEVPVLFKPAAQEPYEGTLTVPHNDPAQPAVVVKLKGEGSTVGRIEVEPETLDFGRVGENEQNVVGLVIRSVGTADLIVESIELDPSSAPEFSFAGSARTPATLPAPAGGQPGAEVVLPVRCAPTDATVPTELTGLVRITSTDPDRRVVEVRLVASVNRAPIAEIAPLGAGVAAPQDLLVLDGTASRDPDGDDPIVHQWRVFRRPIGSEAEFEDATSPTPRIVVDEPGDYEFGLDVADATGLSCLHPQADPRIPCARIQVTVKPADDLYFELVWDHAETDLDLHLTERGAALYSNKDCYYGNPQPDFGDFGTLLDDPRLVRDDLNGYGPETIVHSKPKEGTTDVSVVYYSDHGAEEPLTRATVRVYVYGVLAAEVTRELERPGLEWDVLTVEWPAATITAIDTVQEAPPP